jgi:Ca-activated chloride channel family protein
MGSSVSLKCTLNREFVPADKKSIVYLAMDIWPPDGTMSPLGMSSAICLLIDRSGSMWGKKLNQAKEAAQRLIDQLQPGDSIGLITFSSKVEPVVEMDQIQSLDVSDLKNKIQKIKCGGGTELYRGLDTAFLQFVRSGSTSGEMVRRVILLSDGEPTDHMPDSHFIKLATEMGNAGISVMALGVGKEYNEDLLGDIAENSRGVWKHISDASDIPAIFTQQLEETRTVVRTSLRVSTHMEKDVEIKEIYKASPEVYSIDFKRTGDDDVKIALGDVKAGMRQMIVAKLAVPLKPEGPFTLGKVYVTDEPAVQSDIKVTYTKDENLFGAENDAFPRGAFLQAETQALTKKGLSGDTEALERARQQAETLARDQTLTRSGTFGKDMEGVVKILDKTNKGMTEEETKLAKQDMTQTRRWRE